MGERERIQKYVEERDAFRDRIINDDGFGLHYAAESGDVDLAAIKIDIAGTDINYRDEQGFTPLLKAVLREQEEFITFILDKGADPDIQTNEGFTALMGAVEMGFDHIVGILLDHGLNPDIRNREGATALHIAAARGNVKIIKKLLEYGADRTIRDNTDMIKLLEKTSGREVIKISGDDKMCNGLTPADIARICRQKEAEEILRQE